MKLLLILIAAAAGFGGGVYWGVHHPVQAQGLAAEEERRFLELQLKTSETLKAKLDQLASKQHSQTPEGTSGFVGSGFVSGGAAAPDPDIKSLQQQQDLQIQQLQQRLQQLK